MGTPPPNSHAEREAVSTRGLLGKDAVAVCQWENQGSLNLKLPCIRSAPSNWMLKINGAAWCGGCDALGAEAGSSRVWG